MTTRRLASGRNPNWALMEKFEVPDYDHPERNYLTRWRVVQTPWFALYLHRLDGPDPRHCLHDHPWSFLSFLLKGGYVEVVPINQDDPDFAETKERHINRVNHKRPQDLHYIKRLLHSPTWTLLLVGRRKRVWGYLDQGGWTAFDQHPYAAEFEEALVKRQATDRKKQPYD